MNVKFLFVCPPIDVEFQNAEDLGGLAGEREKASISTQLSVQNYFWHLLYVFSLYIKNNLPGAAKSK